MLVQAALGPGLLYHAHQFLLCDAVVPSAAKDLGHQAFPLGKQEIQRDVYKRQVLDRLSLYPMNWALNLDGHLSLWAGIALLLIPTVLMFLGTSYILKNKLNLE